MSDLKLSAEDEVLLESLVLAASDNVARAPASDRDQFAPERRRAFVETSGDENVYLGTGDAWVDVSENTGFVSALLGSDSLKAEEMNNIHFAKDRSASEISDLLTTVGATVVFASDSTLEDHVENGADDTTVKVLDGVTVAFADGASPNPETFNDSTFSYLIYSDGYDGFTVRNHGTLDPNEPNIQSDWGNGVSVRNGSDIRVDGDNGNVVRCGTGYVHIDCDDMYVTDLYADDFHEGVTVFRGCVDFKVDTVEGVYSGSGKEVVDLFAYNEDYTVKNVIGRGGNLNIVECEHSPNGTIKNVYAEGDDNKIVFVNDTVNNQDGIRSSRSPPGHTDDVTVDGVYGTGEWGVKAECAANSMDNFTIKNVDVETTGRSVYILPRTDGLMSNLTVEGSLRNTDAGGDKGAVAAFIGQDTGTIDGVTVDLEVESASYFAARIAGASDISGVIKVLPESDSGVDVFAADGQSVTGVDLRVYAKDLSGQGVILAGTGTGTVTDVHIDGTSLGNSPDVDIQSEISDVRLSLNYSNLTNNGTNVSAVDTSAV